ncbi:oxidoreductase [uncultured Flavobacterium sp.]|uniref:oxidoreductase n=1 Tax=uncultured Flavobacterium sp. TaxID=165435 RepID=UPI0025D66468|nr:oxidoreductase [uncultured Flavobacterium sp.]
MWTKNNIPSQAGKTAIITGANSGIGYETALALYESGAHVILACRSLEKAGEAISKMQTHGGKGTLEGKVLDLESLKSVKEFAGTVLKEYANLAILVNNAGVMTPPASQTRDGLELQFGVNFLGHYALTACLYPLLAKTEDARIVTVTSLAYVSGAIDFANLRLEKPYDAFREYSQSKLADMLFSMELQRRIMANKDNVKSIAAHPGVTKTELSRHMSAEAYSDAVSRFGELMASWQGALPSLYAATAAEAAGGKLYGPDSEDGLRGYPARQAIAPNGLDEKTAEKLWETAAMLTGIHFLAQ